MVTRVGAPTTRLRLSNSQPLSARSASVRFSNGPKTDPSTGPISAHQLPSLSGSAWAWKSPWLVTLLQDYVGRSATEATMEPPVTVSRNQGSKSASEQGNGLSQSTA